MHVILESIISMCYRAFFSTMSCSTKRWVVSAEMTPEILKESLNEASKLLSQGEAIAFPTETVYGLGANALSDDAVRKIYAAKGRPSDNPLIVHVCDESMMLSIASEVPLSAKKLCEKFWPGPLTVLVPSNGRVSRLCTAGSYICCILSYVSGQACVGVRMPSHPVALELIRLAGVPIAAPSANVSGKPSPTTADHVLQDLSGRILGVVDGGACGIGVESTVVDCSGADDTVTILRPGGITQEQLQSVIPHVFLDPGLTGDVAPKAPGMKYTHYAPRAPVHIIDGPKELFIDVLKYFKSKGGKIGVLCCRESVEVLSPWADSVKECGSSHNLEEVARDLYSCLRGFDDETNVTLILAESFPVSEIGQAIMNRLNKSAGHRIIRSLEDAVDLAK